MPGLLHLYDEHGQPLDEEVLVSITLDYYAGVSDGFAGFGTMCWGDYPSSPSTCLNGAGQTGDRRTPPRL